MYQPYPSYVPPAPTSKTNALSIISLVTGILGVLFTCPAIFVPLFAICNAPLSLGALITGLISLNQINKTRNIEKGRGMAIAGIILGLIILIIALIYITLLLLVFFGLMTIPFISNTIPTY